MPFNTAVAKAAPALKALKLPIKEVDIG